MFAHDDKSFSQARGLMMSYLAAGLLAALLPVQLARAQSGTVAVGGSNACAGSEPISGPGPFLFDNQTATTDGVASDVCSFFDQTQIDHDVWYCWSAPQEACPGGYLVETCGETSVDTKIAVYNGCGVCPPQTPLSCADDDCGGQFRQSRVLFDAVPGGAYTIRVGTFPGVSGGTGNFNITCSTPPANDDCEDSIPVSGEGFVSFDNIGATLDGPLHTACAQLVGADDRRHPETDHDAWYCWTSPCTAKVFVQTCDLTLVDTKLFVYDGCSCPPDESNVLACNDDDSVCDPNDPRSRLAFDAIQGHEYLVRVGTYAGAKGGIGNVSFECGQAACPGTGSCTTPQSSPGCADQACCEKVCAQDRYCCSGAGQWDSICARRASGICQGAFNTCSPTAGTCLTQGGNGTPGCNDSVCCNSVCAVDPFCCISDWDAQCAAEAAGICGGGFTECDNGSGSCQGLPGHGDPGCDDDTCCDSICALDPFCCVVGWDDVCALREGNDCQLACGLGVGDCYADHGGAGCEDAECCATVCDLDPFCCASGWDELCSERANLLCGSNCPVGDITWVDPPDGTVYAGYPIDPDSQTPLGPRTFDILAAFGTSAGCFDICETAESDGPNSIKSVTTEVVSGGSLVYRITLARPITPGAVTVLTYTDNNTAVQSGIFTAHPANVDADAVTSSLDIMAMIDCCLNGSCTPPWGDYSCDIDQSGGVHPPDMIALIDLLNGGGPFDPWNGTALPALGPPCD